jgi:hypothetical protein
MSPRNVIITLVVVIALIVFFLFKIRMEPKKKFSFNRNPSRIEYSQIALCKMDCQNINANDITVVLRKGEVNNDKSDMHKRPCGFFTILGKTKKGMVLSVMIDQCGTVARITNCYLDNGLMPCNCVENDQPVSFIKIKPDALPA